MQKDQFFVGAMYVAAGFNAVLGIGAMFLVASIPFQLRALPTTQNEIKTTCHRPAPIMPGNQTLECASANTPR